VASPQNCIILIPCKRILTALDHYKNSTLLWLYRTCFILMLVIYTLQGLDVCLGEDRLAVTSLHARPPPPLPVAAFSISVPANVLACWLGSSLESCPRRMAVHSFHRAELQSPSEAFASFRFGRLLVLVGDADADDVPSRVFRFPSLTEGGDTGGPGDQVLSLSELCQSGPASSRRFI
jgi:hypothetical protein